jgi:hypothetical protein
MNKEQEELLDKAYENYLNKAKNYTTEDLFYNKLSGVGDIIEGMLSAYTRDFIPYSKEEFIKKCKTDTEFSQRWGLKIEERELSLEEKEWQLEKTNCINDIENDRVIYGHKWEKYIQEQYEGIQSNQGIKIPTKLITLEYNGIKIESYE